MINIEMCDVLQFVLSERQTQSLCERMMKDHLKGAYFIYKPLHNRSLCCFEWMKGDWGET